MEVPEHLIRLNAAIGRFQHIIRALKRGQAVNINIRDNANSSAREEICGRIAGLVEAAKLSQIAADEPDTAGVNAADRLREEAQAFFLALLGFAPTGDELEKMIP